MNNNCSYCGHAHHTEGNTVCDRVVHDYGLPMKESDGTIPQEPKIDWEKEYYKLKKKRFEKPVPIMESPDIESLKALHKIEIAHFHKKIAKLKEYQVDSEKVRDVITENIALNMKIEKLKDEGLRLFNHLNQEISESMQFLPLKNKMALRAKLNEIKKPSP